MTVPALPFTIKRSADVFDRSGITSTTETVHGVLRLGAEALEVQWRVHRATDRIGDEMRSDQEVEPVRSARIPLAELAGAAARRSWWALWGGDRLVLTASTLDAFAAISGPEGLSLEHPAQLVLRIARHDRAAAQDFAADLQLAVGERALRLASGEATSEPGRFPGP